MPGKVSTDTEPNKLKQSSNTEYHSNLLYFHNTLLNITIYSVIPSQYIKIFSSLQAPQVVAAGGVRPPASTPNPHVWHCIYKGNMSFIPFILARDSGVQIHIYFKLQEDSPNVKSKFRSQSLTKIREDWRHTSHSRHYQFSTEGNKLNEPGVAMADEPGNKRASNYKIQSIKSFKNKILFLINYKYHKSHLSCTCFRNLYF